VKQEGKRYRRERGGGKSSKREYNVSRTGKVKTRCNYKEIATTTSWGFGIFCRKTISPLRKILQEQGPGNKGKQERRSISEKKVRIISKGITSSVESKSEYGHATKELRPISTRVKAKRGIDHPNARENILSVARERLAFLEEALKGEGSNLSVKIKRRRKYGRSIAVGKLRRRSRLHKNAVASGAKRRVPHLVSGVPRLFYLLKSGASWVFS